MSRKLIRVLSCLAALFIVYATGSLLAQDGSSRDGTGANRRNGPSPVTSPEPLTMAAVVGGAVVVGGVVYRMRRRGEEQ